MKKVLWLSRHTMTTEQKTALGSGVQVTQINGQFSNVHVPFRAEVNGESQELPPFKVVAKDFDVLAIVLPIHLEKAVLDIAGDKPVIKALNRRELVKDENGGEDKVVFNFDGWERLVEIRLVTEPFDGI